MPINTMQTIENISLHNWMHANVKGKLTQGVRQKDSQSPLLLKNVKQRDSNTMLCRRRRSNIRNQRRPPKINSHLLYNRYSMTKWNIWHKILFFWLKSEVNQFIYIIFPSVRPIKLSILTFENVWILSWLKCTKL